MSTLRALSYLRKRRASAPGAWAPKARSPSSASPLSYVVPSGYLGYCVARSRRTSRRARRLPPAPAASTRRAEPRRRRACRGRSSARWRWPIGAGFSRHPHRCHSHRLGPSLRCRRCGRCSARERSSLAGCAPLHRTALCRRTPLRSRPAAARGRARGSKALSARKRCAPPRPPLGGRGRMAAWRISPRPAYWLVSAVQGAEVTEGR